MDIRGRRDESRRGRGLLHVRRARVGSQSHGAIMNLRRNRDSRTAPETPHRLRYGTALLLRLVHRLRRTGPVERPHAGAVPGWSPLAETNAVAPAVPLMETDVDADLRWAAELHHFEHVMQ